MPWPSRILSRAVPIALSVFGVGVAACATAELPLREIRYELDFEIDFENEQLEATVDLTVGNRGTAPAGTLDLLLYRLLTVTDVRAVSGRPLDFTQDVVPVEGRAKQQVNAIRVTLAEPVPPGESTTVRIAYSGYLLGYVEIGWLYVRDRIAPEFSILRKDCLAYPEVGVPDRRVNRAAGLPEFTYEARITVPADLVVANGGALVGRRETRGRATFVYRSLKPAWRMDFAVAEYRILEEGPYRVFHFAEDAEGATAVLRSLRRTVDLYTGWFGPLQGAEGFTVIEIPDGWGSQADVTSIIQTAAAFRDPARRRELYHEVSHLWNVPATDVSPRWNEGLAAYLEYRTADVLEGTNELPGRVAQYLERIRGPSADETRWDDTPMIDYGREGLTDLSYVSGMVLFAVLHETVGEEAFHEIFAELYRRYHETGASTEQFVALADSLTDSDLTTFFDDWLYGTRWYGWVQEGMTCEQLARRYVTGSASE